MIDHMFIHGCSHTAAVELPSWENNEQGLPSKDSLIRDIPQRCYEDSWANQLGVKLLALLLKQDQTIFRGMK